MPITTPPRSPQPNGLSEAFVNTLRRDHVGGADLATAAAVLAQAPAWIADYNAEAPHSALGYRSPTQFRLSKSRATSSSRHRLGAKPGAAIPGSTRSFWGAAFSVYDPPRRATPRPVRLVLAPLPHGVSPLGPLTRNSLTLR
ncbi:MAG: integrase core domain-containing protein [Gemmatimonadaceae bacterium]